MGSSCVFPSSPVIFEVGWRHLLVSNRFSHVVEVVVLRTTPWILLLALFGLTVSALHAEVPPAEGEKGADAKDKDKAPEPIPAAVQLLVEQLGSPDFRKRIEAERRLKEAGSAVVPALRLALGHPNLEVRTRARNLLPLLANSSVITPTRLTLSVKDKTVKDIFAEISKQTGYEINAYPSDANARYSFDFKDRIFWEAMDEICRRCNLHLQQSYGNLQLRLYSQNRQPAFVNYSGCFRFTANTLQYYRSVDLTSVAAGEAPSRNENLTLSFTVYSEPKSPLLALGQPQVTAAYDTEKNSMVIPMTSEPSGQSRWYSRYGSGSRLQMQTQLNLQRRSEKATGIKVVRGLLPIVLLTDQKLVVLTEKILEAEGKKAKVGDLSFAIEKVTKQANGQYQVKFTVKRDSKENDYYWMNNLYQRLELHDAKGNKFRSYGSSWGNSGPNFVNMTLTYRHPTNAKGKDAEPARFLFQQWTTAHQLVRFEFKDLPLP
jgi:hypothetical protein